MANNVTGINREINIQRLSMTKENKALFNKLVNRNTMSGNSGPVDLPINIPTFPVGGDSVSFSTRALAMLDAQQTTDNANNIQPGTANARRAAAGQPIREIPEEHQRYVFRHTDFRIFAESVLSPHMENYEEHLAKMTLAILHTNASVMADLSLAERTMMRESILREAMRIADAYLEGENAERFVDGFANLIREAEMTERGYVRVENRRDPNNITFRRPFDYDSVNGNIHARNEFVLANMTAEQQAHMDALISESHRLLDESQDLGRDENGNLRINWNNYMQENHPDAWQAHVDVTLAVRAFWDEMAEYHGFQEQWDAWQSNDYAENNWFANASAAFEENSTNIATEIEEIRFNLLEQLNLSGMGAFKSIFEQLRLNNEENLFWYWLMNLQVFAFNE